MYANEGLCRDNLRDLMQQKNLTAKDLAALIETDEDREKEVKLFRIVESWISKRAAMPSADRAVSIAKALGVSVEFLITGHDDHISFEDNELLQLVRKYRSILHDLEIMDTFTFNTVKVQIEAVADGFRITVENQKSKA